MIDRRTALVIAALAGVLVLGGIATGVITVGDVDPATEPADDADSADSVFDGEIDNVDVEPMTLTGEGVYDRNCVPVDPENEPLSVVTCDAGIETDEYGVLNFHYEHDMSVDPCIGPGDHVEVEIRDEDGTATASVEYR